MLATNLMRCISPDDLPWGRELSLKRYRGIDWPSCEAWFVRHVFKDPVHFYAVRTDNAFIVSRLDRQPWYPDDPEVYVQLACADEGCMWELFRLMRNSIEWARLCNAKHWRCCSNTEYDFAPIANRLGAREITPRFLMVLR